mgnify:CR=1 FL=1
MLLMLENIFSSLDGLVIFSDRSWITDYGKYDSISKKFTAFKDIDDEEKYISYNIDNFEGNLDLFKKELEFGMRFFEDSPCSAEWDAEQSKVSSIRGTFDCFL